MMKTYAVLLALLTVGVMPALVSAAPGTTYITNMSQKSVRATIQSVKTTFVDQLIAPGVYMGETYSDCDSSRPHSLAIAIWVDGSHEQSLIAVDCDRSIVCYDTADTTGVDIFLSVYGSLVDKDGLAIGTITE